MDLLMTTLPASTSSVMPFTETMRCPCDMAPLCQVFRPPCFPSVNHLKTAHFYSSIFVESRDMTWENTTLARKFGPKASKSAITVADLTLDGNSDCGCNAQIASIKKSSNWVVIQNSHTSKFSGIIHTAASIGGVTDHWKITWKITCCASPPSPDSQDACCSTWTCRLKIHWGDHICMS